MTPTDAERCLQQGYLNGQEALKAIRRRRLKLLAGVVVKLSRAVRRP